MNMVQGSGIDAPLNENGRLQANKFHAAYGRESFDKIYISSLQRTYQSVEKFIDQGISYEKLSGLNEISWGSQEGKEFSEESSKLYHQTVTDWKGGNLDATVGGGESPNQVMARQKEAMEIILSNPDERKVLICMHGRAMRIMLTWMLNYGLEKMDMFEHSNLGLYEVIHTGTMFRIDRFNDTSHLT